MRFDSKMLTDEDFCTAMSIVGDVDRLRYEPDLVIGEDGKPYLFRWHIIPRQKKGNVYFHIQTGSDPQRPVHDHPWDNTTVVLANGYDELWEPQPWLPHSPYTRKLRKGDVVHRTAGEAHRLLLPAEFPYAMTLFTTGPVYRDWGFWFPDGWRNADTVLEMEQGMSTFTEEAKADE